MILKNIIDEDFTNYKKISMVLGFPYCTFKCDKECGRPVCQNSILAKSESVEIPINKVIDRYVKNSISDAVVCGGLEPFDTFDDLVTFIEAFREVSDDDVVIYTGYTEEELLAQINILSNFKNIYIKFGRFIPDQEKHYDDTLGIYLASDNQYGKKIS
jgi:hypothetical protein